MPSFVGRAGEPEGRPYVDVIDLASPSPSPVPIVTRTINGRPQTGAGSVRQPYAYSSSSPSHQVLKPKQANSSYNRPPVRPAQPNTAAQGSSFANFIKPSTPGAFKQAGSSTAGGPRPPQPQFGASIRPKHSTSSQSSRQGQGLSGQFPTWITQGKPNPALNMPAHKPLSAPKLNKTNTQPEDDPDAERFDLNAIPLHASDYERVSSAEADAHMRELLSGAVGDGEAEEQGFKDGEDTIEGFANGIRLMPHQVRGVNWMRQRESGRKYGGILADDMGLGKTVQTLARIVEGVATAAEKKAGYKAGTLIVAPLAVMEQWAQECISKTQPGRLKVTTHHGPSRTKSAKVLESFDVVITTFQTLASEHTAFETSRQATLDASDSDSGSESDGQRFGKTAKSKVKPKAKAKKPAPSALFEVKWLRVVVDEAQHIKNRTTKAAKAAVALKAKYRWCLTGTPIQNNVEELFSLFQFLRAKPLDDWTTFKERISSLVKEGKTKLAMKRLHIVLKAIMLRRMKDAVIDGKPILNLPARLVQVVKCDFDAEERAFYDALEQKTSLTFNKYLKSGSAMANYTSVLTMLLRMRQACDHPSLVAHSLSEDKDALESKAAPAEEKDEADDLANLLGGLGVAGGAKCEVCFIQLSDATSKHCDECATLARRARARSVEGVDGLPPSSAKIRMLLKLIMETEKKSDGKEKTIVFSQFTSFLNLIEPFLKSHGIAYVRYDGSMRNDKRQESLEKIKTSKSVNVILISFKAGSTGLNLTCCNNVILMDLWWNPALEDQAFDRAHRLGQKLDVNIYKLTIEETVEDRILTLQNNKRELAKAALSGEATKNMKLTMNDIMDLFKRSARHDDDSDDE